MEERKQIVEHTLGAAEYVMLSMTTAALWILAFVAWTHQF